MTEPNVTAWYSEKDPLTVRRVGKLAEEVNELGAVASRIIIQGLNEIDPSSKKLNKVRLEEEIADVMAQCELCVEQLDLDQNFIHHRMEIKKLRMGEWEELLEQK